jgi:leucyl aminopeptidase
VVVGAHFDSVGGPANARAPGADDNASGVTALLGALSILAQNPYSPAPTVEFHFYSAEEGGLRGSSDIWSSYKAQGKTVLAFVNQDMAGYSPSGKVSVYQDYDDDSLSAWMRVLATGYVGGYTEDLCGYGCSDHASAFANGFRKSCLPFFFSTVLLPPFPVFVFPFLPWLEVFRFNILI